MELSLQALGRAMEAREMRLAVFDVGVRRHAGQWYLDTEIPLTPVIDQFREEPAFMDDDGTLEIPLHESDSAALTNTFIRVAPGGGRAQFYDPGVNRVRTVDIDQLERSYLAWKLRFWSAAFDCDEQPPFMLEFEGDGKATTIASLPTQDDTSEMQATAFFEAVRSTLVATKERRREAMRDTFLRIDSAEYISEYGGISAVHTTGRSVDEYGQQVIELQVPSGEGRSDAENPDTSVRAGDEVVVNAPDIDQLPVEAEVFTFDGETLELGVYWDSARGNNPEQAFDLALDEPLIVGKLVDGRRFHTIAEAIETVDRTDHARKRYVGDIEATFADLPEIAADLPLNRDQVRAVRAGYTAEDVCCIHAPPWTGTRRVIWEIARAAIDTGEQVCVFVPERADIETLLGSHTPDLAETSLHHRIDAMDIDVQILRSVHDHADTSSDLLIAPLATADAIDDHSVDLAIVDQANSVDVPTGAIPFAKAGRVVVLGDPFQRTAGNTQPSYGSDLPDSLFEHLSARVPDSQCALRCQYRLHQAIAQFPNQYFYDGSLIHGGENRTWTIDTLDPLTAIHVTESVRSTPTGSVYHDDEIDAVLAEVNALRERGLSGEAIGIITPYSAQIGKIRVALNAVADGLGETVLIGDVDTIGCHHCDALIVSFVGGGDPSIGDRREGEYFATAAGLNMTMTRGTKRLVLIGDWRNIAERSAAHAELASFLADRGLIDPELVR